jgi:hypothetical protein
MAPEDRQDPFLEGKRLVLVPELLRLDLEVGFLVTGDELEQDGLNGSRGAMLEGKDDPVASGGEVRITIAKRVQIGASPE